jgi:O-Antigen ligase
MIGKSAGQLEVSQLAIASCWVVAAYLVLKMFYLFGTGSAQPADIMLTALAIVVVSPRRMLTFMRENSIYLMFLIWVVLVNAVWSAIYFRFDFMSSASYYLFNALLLVAVYSIRGNAPVEFDRIAILGLRASILIQFIAVMANGSLVRSIGTFNNPNQLAYWGVAVMSMYLLIRRNVTNWLDLPFLLLGTYCVVASLSRAGTVGVAVMLAAWFWMALETPGRRIMGALGGVLLVIAATQGPNLLQLAQGNQTVENFETRLETRRKEDSAEVRNWDRVSEFYQYNILGSGEGYFRRWEGNTGYAIEIHSTFFTLLFSYGLVGLGLFLGFMLTVAKRIPWSLSAYLLPSLFYGISHQGLRFSFFWLLIGVMCSMAAHSRDITARRPSPKPASAVQPELHSWRSRGPEHLRKLAGKAGDR